MGKDVTYRTLPSQKKRKSAKNDDYILKTMSIKAGLKSPPPEQYTNRNAIGRAFHAIYSNVTSTLIIPFPTHP